MSSIHLQTDVQYKITNVVSSIRKSVEDNPDVQLEISGYLPSKRGAKLEIQFLDSIDDALTKEWILLVNKQGGEAYVDVDLQNGIVTMTMEYKKRCRCFKSVLVWLLLPVIYYYLIKINPDRYLFL